MNRVGAAKLLLNKQVKKQKVQHWHQMPSSQWMIRLKQLQKQGLQQLFNQAVRLKMQDSIKKANEYGIAMVFTGVRHFKH